jgi:hypothetical protein
MCARAERANARSREAAQPNPARDQAIGGRKGVSTEPSTNNGRSIGDGGGGTVTLNAGTPAGNAATIMQASAQSASDFAGQHGHFGVWPSWWPAIVQ